MSYLKAMNKNHSIPSFIITAIIALTAQLGFECTNRSQNKINPINKTDTATGILLKPPSSFADTLVIQNPSAVFYNPDSVQLDQIRAINKKMVFESLEHDCFYQMRNARLVLQKYWPQIRVVETSKARYLTFIKADKTKTTIDLNSKNDICGIFLFDSKQDPELIDMMNVDTELGFYFKK